MKTYGLIGKNIEYSFSRDYFKNKFGSEQIKDCRYVNFDVPSLDKIRTIFQQEEHSGYNVTIPYKQDIIPFLDDLSEEAQKIGAVNTIQITPERKLIGHNTDYYGFLHSIKPLLKPHHNRALLLGLGGAAKAIIFALQQLNIDYCIVSRNPVKDQLSYAELNDTIITQHPIIINCTPLGTYPDIERFPEIPYESIGAQHLLYDLIYNPAETLFLQKGKEKGAVTKNGYEMLTLQAEKAWEIWNKNLY